MVLITAKSTADGPCVKVADNGPGIGLAERDKVFKRFHRCSSAIGIPGNGLGLSMATTIVELHGLFLRFEDNHPGASFEIAPQISSPLATTTGLREATEIGSSRKLLGTWHFRGNERTPGRPESLLSHVDPVAHADAPGDP